MELDWNRFLFGWSRTTLCTVRIVGHEVEEDT
jgi:hypothetical protein